MKLQGLDTLRPDEADRIKTLADMGGESFMEELMTQELLSVLPLDHAAKTEISQAIIHSNLVAAAPHEAAYCTEDGAALAIGCLKSEIAPLAWVDIEAEADRLAFDSMEDAEIRRALIEQFEKMDPITDFGWEGEFAQPSEKNPTADYIRFSFFAVDKEKRGSGAFRRLVEPFFEYADAHGIPCFLETYSDRLEQLYGHFGFETVKELRSPDFQIYERCMMRPPQA